MITNQEQPVNLSTESQASRVDISIIIPVYNGASHLHHTLITLNQFMAPRPLTYEIIVVDDGSTDRSAQVVKELSLSSVRLISYSPNRGKGYAVRQGIHCARGNSLIFTDVDLPYGIEPIMTLLEALQHSDIAIIDRTLPQSYHRYPVNRFFSSLLFRLLIRTLYRLPVGDTQAGLKAFRAEAAQKIFRLATVNGFAFDIEILALAQLLGFSLTAIPATCHNDYRHSTVRLWRDAIQCLKDQVKIISNLHRQKAALRRQLCSSEQRRRVPS